MIMKRTLGLIQTIQNGAHLGIAPEKDGCIFSREMKEPWVGRALFRIIDISGDVVFRIRLGCRQRASAIPFFKLPRDGRLDQRGQLMLA